MKYDITRQKFGFVSVFKKCFLSIFLLLSMSKQVLAEEAKEPQVETNEGAGNNGYDVTEDVEDVEESSIFNKVNSEPSKTDEISDKESYYNAANVVILNKVTANSEKRKLIRGKVSYYNNAAITLKKCLQTMENGVPTAKVFVELMEDRVDDDRKSIFRGWLVSDQPALHTIEHPIYEIFPISCAGDKIRGNQ